MAMKTLGYLLSSFILVTLISTPVISQSRSTADQTVVFAVHRTVQFDQNVLSGTNPRSPESQTIYQRSFLKVTYMVAAGVYYDSEKIGVSSSAVDINSLQEPYDTKAAGKPSIITVTE
jgi:hypothetical protein